MPKPAPRALILSALMLAVPVVARSSDSASTAASTAPPVVEVRTTDYAFHAPSELRSGWTTLRMTNEGAEPHFMVFWKLPEDRTFDDYVHEVYEPFMALFGRYKAEEISRDELLGGLGEQLPAWLDLAGMGRGGPGLLSPGRTAETTVDLPPGDYVLECYMVNAEGKVHNQLGMLRPLTVSAESTGASPPSADVEMRISNTGVEVEGELDAGDHTVKVTVTEPPPGFLGHDLHLAKLPADLEIPDLLAWMSWVDGLNPPAPAEFLGGVEQVPAGHSSYLTVTLEPGRYLWLSEEYGSQGVLHEFRVE